PYGTGRFSVYNGKTFSGGLDSQTKALQYLQLLIESGYPLKIGYTYLKTSDEWYNIFKLIFEIIPQPCLFYTLQYSDKDVLARAAQDYINSEFLTSETNKVLPELLTIYLDVYTPEQFKHNILHFCTELFPAIDPKSWQSLIYKIWKLDSFKSKALDDFYSAEYSFIKSAIWYIEDDKIIKKIIEDILINYNHLEGESDARINLLYRTTNKKLKSTTNYVKEIKPLIDHVIDSLLDNLEGWFIVINIHSLLSSNQKSRINKKILLLNYDGIKYSNLWYILTFFANTDESKQLIKSKVIGNNLFWNATKTTISYNHYIPLYLITQKNGNEIGLEWTKDEMNEILKKLNALINDWKVNDEDRHDFKSLLQELNKFIDMTQDKFKSLPNHKKTANILLSLYKESRGYDTIIAGLLSNQKSIIIWALSDLSYLIKEYPNHPEIFRSIPILINKILLQSEPAIEASLNYLAVWINDDKNIETFKPYVNLLILILKKYKEAPLINSDQLFVQRQLIVIAMVLSKWKVKDSIINEWIGIRNESKYFSNRNINLDRVY
ncbi:MAG: hypothetical protein ACTHJT_04045, partial [Cytophaga sp.]|uniref:hypothetical protein n=1 Tax=Cytophaga sp. TaxID=29535 RepID=UPI003F81D54A